MCVQLLGIKLISWGVRRGKSYGSLRFSPKRTLCVCVCVCLFGSGSLSFLLALSLSVLFHSFLLRFFFFVCVLGSDKPDWSFVKDKSGLHSMSNRDFNA